MCDKNENRSSVNYLVGEASLERKPGRVGGAKKGAGKLFVHAAILGKRRHFQGKLHSSPPARLP